MKGAAALFLETVPTFGSYELMLYDQLIFYAVITSVLGECDDANSCAEIGQRASSPLAELQWNYKYMKPVEPAIHRFLLLALDRPDIRLKVFKSNEIQEEWVCSLICACMWICARLQLIGGDDTFYNCSYDAFFAHLASLEAQRPKFDRYLAPHYGIYSRAIRLKAYTQFLAPYKMIFLHFGFCILRSSCKTSGSTRYDGAQLWRLERVHRPRAASPHCVRLAQLSHSDESSRQQG